MTMATSMATAAAPAIGGGKVSGEPSIGIGRYVFLGMLIALLLVGSIGVWSVTAELAGAVVAGGTVVVDSNVKKVQHPSGGVVGEILVKDGDHVTAGQLLMRLDDTITRANLQVVTKQLDELAVREARLRAEIDDADLPTVPKSLADRLDDPQVTEILESEWALFASRHGGIESKKAQLKERTGQLRDEATGLEAQKLAKDKELEFAHKELAGLETLEKQGLVTTTKITAMRRDVARLEAERAQAVAGLAQARGKISEIELLLLQVVQDMKSEASKDLREVQGKQAELSERRVAAQDQLKRIDVLSPQKGIVHQLSVHTVGGVVSPSEPIMLIVPDHDQLVLEAKISPVDIDQVKVGHTAFVRFSAFNQRTTPEVEGVVERISADLLKEGGPAAQQSAQAIAYYVARISLPAAEMAKLKGLTLLPGMPAEVHIKTIDRTAFSYFFKPVMDQFARAFRER